MPAECDYDGDADVDVQCEDDGTALPMDATPQLFNTWQEADEYAKCNLHRYLVKGKSALKSSGQCWYYKCAGCTTDDTGAGGRFRVVQRGSQWLAEPCGTHTHQGSAVGRYAFVKTTDRARIRDNVVLMRDTPKHILHRERTTPMVCDLSRNQISMMS